VFDEKPQRGGGLAALAGGEGLRRRLEPCLYKARLDKRLAMARKRRIFGRASAHDVEAAQHDGLTR
jgi:hypothetical protein